MQLPYEQENYGTVRGDLSSVQQELMQCNAQVDQLRSKLKHEQMQVRDIVF